MLKEILKYRTTKNAVVKAKTALEEACEEEGMDFEKILKVARSEMSLAELRFYLAHYETMGR